jgi:DNA (cytosine-5)-methyltransferase 1
MTRLRLLDVYSGAGGCARGYQQAGFHVTGVDINPQPRYAGDVFVQADALAYLATADLTRFDAIHASPPCKLFTPLAALHGPGRHVDLVEPTRQALIRSGLPWVIENVPGAPIRPDIVLCGEMFNLGVRRHRWFETDSLLYSLVPPCRHHQRVVSVHGMPGGRSTRDGLMPVLADWKQAMDIDWMSARELNQAIPPAYTAHVGALLADHIRATPPTKELSTR